MPPNPAPEPRNHGAPQPRHLREIVAGYDLAAWPFATPLEKGESLGGWWRRIAIRYGVSPAALLREAHLRVGSYSLDGVERRLALPNDVLSTLTRVTDDERLNARSLSSPATHLLALVKTHRAPATPPKIAGSRFCPQCLANGRPWLAIWRDPLVPICVDHHVFLEERCPKCSQPPFNTTSWAVHEHEIHECTEPSLEPRPARARRAQCRFDLRLATPRRASAESLAAARWLQRLRAQPDDHVEVAGLPVLAREAEDAAALLALDALSQSAPDDRRAEAIGRALTAAYAVLSQPDLTRAADRAEELRLLSPAGPLTPIAPASEVRQSPINPVLQAIRLHALRDHLAPTTQLAFRIGSAWPRTPNSLRHHRTKSPARFRNWSVDPVPFDRIPQLYWADPEDKSGLHLDERDRFALSLAIACVGRTITTAEAAERLGAPRHAALNFASDWAALSAWSGWATFRSAAVRTATLLATRKGMPNYARRRALLPTPSAVDRVIHMMSPDTQLSDEERLWVWSAATSSSSAFTPDGWGDLRAPRVRPRRPTNTETAATAILAVNFAVDEWDSKGEPP